MSLNTNITNLQEILDKVNNLPNSEPQENLEEELNAQSILLEEQNAKIAELANVLANKASGGSGKDIETCTCTIYLEAPTMSTTFYYVNSDLELSSIPLTDDVITFFPMKNSIIYIDDWTASSKTSGDVQKINYYMGRAAYFITGDSVFTFR